MTVFTLLDIRTGLTAEYADAYVPNHECIDPYYSWTEGNWSCDCNRDAAFPWGRGEGDDPNPDPEVVPDDERGCGVCPGCKRYLVVAIEPMPAGYEIDEFNEGYPDDLRDVARRWASMTAEEQVAVLRRVAA